MVIGDDLQTIAEPNQALIMVFAQAHHWLERLTTGTVRSGIDLAEEQGVDKNKISRALRFAYLAPDITQAILDGRHPGELTADRMRRLPDLSMNWQQQRDLFGFQSAKQLLSQHHPDTRVIAKNSQPRGTGKWGPNPPKLTSPAPTVQRNLPLINEYI